MTALFDTPAARTVACDLCQDRPWELFNGVVDDHAPVTCPRCGRSNTERPVAPATELITVSWHEAAHQAVVPAGAWRDSRTVVGRSTLCGRQILAISRDARTGLAIWSPAIAPTCAHCARITARYRTTGP